MTRMREAMKDRGVSASSLSFDTRIQEKTIRRYMAGDTGIKLENAAKIAEALKVSIDWLAGRDEPEWDGVDRRTQAARAAEALESLPDDLPGDQQPAEGTPPGRDSRRDRKPRP